MINKKNERRALLIAFLIALLIHLAILLLLLLQKKLEKKEQQVPFKTETPLTQPPKAPVKFTKEELKTKKEAKPILPQMPPIPSPTQLIPGSSSKETIIDGRPDGTTTDRSKAQIKKESSYAKATADKPEKILEEQKKEPSYAKASEGKPAKIEQEQILEEDSKIESGEDKGIASDHLEKPSTEGLSQKGAKKFKKRVKRSKKARQQQMPKILDRSHSEAPVLKNVIEGFSKWMNENGNNPYLERRGDPNGKLNMEEANLLRYFNKITAFFSNANEPFSNYLQNLIRAYVKKGNRQKIEGQFRLIIGSHGELEDIRVISESGVQEYDRIIVEQFKRAAPFPPIPKYLNKDKVVFPITIYTPLETGNFPYMKFY